jgi:RNA polymerase sigma-70 factor (ECF subfamily)
MATDPLFEEWSKKMHAGDSGAAVELFERYASRLIARARRHLGRKLQQKVDPEDVMQSVFKSFFNGRAAGRLIPENWEHLWALLVTITDRKCYRRFDYFGTKSHDVNREVGEVATPGREPTPDEAATLTDLVETLLKSFDAPDRVIVALHLQGYTIAEIEAESGRAKRTIFRVLDRARQRLKRLMKSSAD